MSESVLVVRGHATTVSCTLGVLPCFLLLPISSSLLEHSLNALHTRCGQVGQSEGSAESVPFSQQQVVFECFPDLLLAPFIDAVNSKLKDGQVYRGLQFSFFLELFSILSLGEPAALEQRLSADKHAPAGKSGPRPPSVAFVLIAVFCRFSVVL